MFLGRQVNDAITLYYRHILEHGERLSVDQVKDAFWDGWKAAAEAEREQLGIAWETDLREDSAFKLGLDAVELTFGRADPAARRARRRPAKGRVHPRRPGSSGASCSHDRRSMNVRHGPHPRGLHPRNRDGSARRFRLPRCAEP